MIVPDVAGAMTHGTSFFRTSEYGRIKIALILGCTTPEETDASQSQNQRQTSLIENTRPTLHTSANTRNTILAAGKTIPLPGPLDHREFTRTAVQLDRCGICDRCAAEYRCEERRVKICEGCYASLMREWNQDNGVF